jgi:hypothetical protein
MSYRRAAPLAVLMITSVLAAVSLTGCQALECGRGEPTPEEALKGLIEASREADSSDDVCKYVTNGFDFEFEDVRALAETYENVDPDELVVEVTEQLGSTVLLTASSKDGSVNEKFQALDAEGDRATIDFGSVD